MRYIDPKCLLDSLVTEVRSGVDFSMSPLVATILSATARPGLIGIPHSVLVEVPLGFEFLEEAAEVLVTCSLPQAFENVRDAFDGERIRFEVRSTQTTAATPSGVNGDVHNPREDFAIFGIIELYCVLCIRRHARLNCLTFQFC